MPIEGAVFGSSFEHAQLMTGTRVLVFPRKSVEDPSNKMNFDLCKTRKGPYPC